MQKLIRYTIILVIFSGYGCGYSFQNSRNPLREKEQIQRVYISRVMNNTYKVGVENLVYNGLVRSFFAHRKVTLVDKPEEADAILEGTVQGASYSGEGAALVSGLNPPGLGANLPTSKFYISTTYAATLSCSFRLIRRVAVPGKGGVVWSSSYVRSKPFPAANQLDVPGTTSSLINDSEFDRSLLDLSRSMMDDVHESMLGMF